MQDITKKPSHMPSNCSTRCQQEPSQPQTTADCGKPTHTKDASSPSTPPPPTTPPSNMTHKKATTSPSTPPSCSAPPMHEKTSTNTRWTWTEPHAPCSANTTCATRKDSPTPISTRHAMPAHSTSQPRHKPAQEKKMRHGNWSTTISTTSEPHPSPTPSQEKN